MKDEMFCMRFYMLAVHLFSLRWLFKYKKYEKQIYIKFETSLVKLHEGIITSYTEFVYLWLGNYK